MANRFDASAVELKEKLVVINRVSKTVKGGRVPHFAAMQKFRKQSEKVSRTQRRT